MGGEHKKYKYETDNYNYVIHLLWIETDTDVQR
jgi:hypothetical protein